MGLLNLRTLSILTILMVSVPVFAQSNAQEQIDTAVLAAPEEERETAKVYGYDAEGKMITLREGSGNMVCIADEPGNDRFQVICYHKDLEPFMERGRVLKAEGKNPREVFDMREEEAVAGTLQMPEKPATMHVYFGSNVTHNEETNSLEGARYRYVVYIPFATQESTGLSLRPNGSGHPWLMDPGTHRAHIMITPPEEKD